MMAVETADRAYMLEDQRRMALAGRYFAWLARLVLPVVGRRVIEVGCSVGNFTGTLLDREAIIAVDIADWAVDAVRKRYPGRTNLYPVACDLAAENFRALARFGADTCVCLNVLEHIEDDRAALGRMASVVGQGGTIVLLVPAFAALYGPIDRKLGHYRRYSRSAIGELAASAGLTVRRAHYVNLAGFFGWWANAHLLRREAQSEGQIRFFDRWVVPFQSRLEAVVPPPFGQSLFVVLGKP